MHSTQPFKTSSPTAVSCILLAALAFCQGCMMVNIPMNFSYSLQEMTLKKAKGWFVSEKILVVDVNGIIREQDDRGIFGGREVCTPHYLKAVLEKAEAERGISAVILRIDSPGGTVNASRILAREIVEFRKRTGKPVYAHIQSTGCSGAYMIAASCSKIHIQPAAITGSIGVIAILPKFARLADKIGVDQIVIKSGPMKDLGNAMRDMTDEEKAVFQTIIDSSYNDFIDWILACRPASGGRDAVKAAADGRIYDANQALEHKLADRICYLDETVTQAMQDARLADAHVVTYGYVDNPDANFYTPATSSGNIPLMNMRIPGALDEFRAGFYYLWLPGR